MKLLSILILAIVANSVLAGIITAEREITYYASTNKEAIEVISDSLKKNPKYIRINRSYKSGSWIGSMLDEPGKLEIEVTYDQKSHN